MLGQSSNLRPNLGAQSPRTRLSEEPFPTAGSCPMYHPPHVAAAHSSMARKFYSLTKNKRRATRGRTFFAVTASRLMARIPCRGHAFFGGPVGTI